MMLIKLRFALKQAFGVEFSDRKLGGFAHVGEPEQFLAERARMIVALRKIAQLAVEG